MKAIKIAIIGGTGVYRADMLESAHNEKINTEYGDTELLCGTYKGKEVFFLARHGSGHTVPPHLINYRANIQALKNLGVEKIIATAAVGSLNEKMRPGEIILTDQFLDFTKNRTSSFYEGGAKGILHVDMTEPYCRELREDIYNISIKADIPVKMGGCYVTAEGPRFETPAEIKMYKMLGGDLVGMTSVPEVVLAREAGMCYATLAMVTNYASGITGNPLSHTEVIKAMAESGQRMSELIMCLIEKIPDKRNCRCKFAAQEAEPF